MLQKILHNYNELENWLSENDFFEDEFLLNITENPLEITVGKLISGNYKAYSEQQIEQFKIVPKKTQELSLNTNEISFGEDVYLEEIDAIENREFFGLKFLTQPNFYFLAEKIKIEKLPILKTTVRPWVSLQEFFVKSELNFIPRPSFWVEEFRK